MENIKNWDDLKNGDLVISPIDNEVTEFRIDMDGDKYLCGKISMFPIFQFNPEDFYIYTGDKKVGETDKKYLK